MDGLKLLLTFGAMALVCVAAAVLAGVVVDQLPAIHDYFSLLVFFGTAALLLVVAWPLAVRLTEPRHAPRSQ
ncbi:MAG: hypothetical protein RO009_23585 [Pseudorhodoplanes sp.]|jgi:membrane protein implicated in regulation of membrane protease activity|nr:hypothetical protein [Pseudorhodoplanes sp.]